MVTAHLNRADADPGGVAGAHLVRHDEDQVGVRDLGHRERPEQGTKVSYQPQIRAVHPTSRSCSRGSF